MRTWSKFMGGILLYAGMLFVLAGADISLSLDPAKPFAGRRVVLTVTARAKNVRIRRLPDVDGIRWSGSGGSRSSMTQMSYSSTSMGGETVVTSQTGVEFIAEKEGRFTIPPFEVLVDGKAAKTPAFAFEVEPKPDFSKSLPGQEKRKRVFALLRIPGMEERKSCYVGEELALDFLIFISRTIPYEVQPLSQPEFRAEKGSASVRFRDYRKKDPRAPNYEGRDAFLQDVDGQEYAVYRFTTRFRPISPGPLKLSAEWTMEFVNGVGFFARRSDPIPVSAELETPVTVEALPALPADMPPFCGLVGPDWKVRGELNPGKSCAGDPATLKIRLDGSGSTEAFRMPPAEFPDFRCYPPEIQRHEDGVCTVSCTLIPLKEGSFDVQTGFSTFDPVSGVYKPFRFRQTMNVKKAETILPAAAAGRSYVDASRAPADEEAGSGAGAASGASSRPRDILYLHRDTSDRVLLPLWKNSLFAVLLAILLGISFFAVSVYRAAREAVQKNDPSFLRRKNARQGKRALLRMLRTASPDELPGLASRISDYLNDTLDLPSGAPLSEAADRFDRGKSVPFAQALRELSERAWMPGAGPALSPRVRTELIRGLSRFTVLFLSSAAVFLHFSGSLEAAEPSGDAALTAYDSGDFRHALEIYSGELKTGTGVSPSLLYNMGNCYYQMGELPRALVCYERAMRLAPRDSDIQENLNLVRRKLLLGEKYRIECPSDLIVWIRDVLRIDEWFLAAAIGFALCLIALGIRSRFRLGWRITAALGVLLLAGALSSALIQKAALYSGCEAVVVRRNAPLFSLPSDRNAEAQNRLKEGREVKVEETRLGWARIRAGGEEGWVREGDILPLWREDMTDLIPEEKQP